MGINIFVQIFIKHSNISNNCKTYVSPQERMNVRSVVNSFHWLDRQSVICPRDSVLKSYYYVRANFDFMKIRTVYSCCDAIVTKTIQGLTKETPYGNIGGQNMYSFLYLYNQIITTLPNFAITGFKLHMNYPARKFAYGVVQSQIFTGK